MTTNQLALSSGGVFGKTILYRNLRVLKERHMVQRVCHDMRPLYAYLARPELDQCLRRPEMEPPDSVRLFDLDHALSVTDALMELLRYSHVKGIAHEAELSTHDIKRFCPGRIPDAIFQIEREQLTYEVALEVETQMKSILRIKEIFALYQNAISNPKNLCSGVLFVIHPECNEEIYKQEREKLPEKDRKKVLIRNPESLKTLSAEFFGSRSERYGITCGMKCEKLRVNSTGGVQYLSIFSTNADFQRAFYPYRPPGSQRTAVNRHG